MKFRTRKKWIRRNVTRLAKEKIPRAFKDKDDRDQWINYICEYHNRKGKVKAHDA